MSKRATFAIDELGLSALQELAGEDVHLSIAKSYIIAENKYGKYAIPKSSIERPACQRILKGEVHEPRTIEFILENAGNIGSIIHAGAYFGDMLPALSKTHNLTWAFEPNNESYKCALKTLELNDLMDGQISVINAALGEYNQYNYLLAENGGMSRISEDGKQFTCVYSIDDWRGCKPSLIHLDIEGYEEKAILGAVQTLKKYKPVLVLETAPDLVFELGYKIIDKFEGNTFLKCE